MSPFDAAGAGAPSPGSTPQEGPPAIEAIGLSKSFGAVKANQSVSVAVRRGTIHGIVGENGAGKSTLMNMLYGYYHPDSGEIRVNGETVRLRSSQDAIERGIGMVHQHFMLVEVFSVLENILLGVEGGFRLRHGVAAARSKLLRLIHEYGLDVDLDASIEHLSVGPRQRVEILKALFREADILILDEPTAVLTPGEATQLFRLLRAFADQGKTVIIITHKLREIMALTDRVTVMRGGRVIGTLDTAETNEGALAEMMIGRRVQAPPRAAAGARGRTVLEVRGLSVFDAQGVLRVDRLSLTVAAGEIVGVAGVAGNGQSELLEALAGLRRLGAGEVLLDGESLTDAGEMPSPRALRRRRLAHVPEDRGHMGLVTAFDARENAILGYHDDPEIGGLLRLRWGRITERCRRFMAGFDVRPADPRLRSGLFSGGNQQKLVLAREIDRDPELLLVGQPTRGVDLGAIEFIHKRLADLRDAGKAILLVSVELDEILALSDRILVMVDGRITGEVARADADEQRLGLLMAGIAA